MNSLGVLIIIINFLYINAICKPKSQDLSPIIPINVTIITERENHDKALIKLRYFQSLNNRGCVKVTFNLSRIIYLDDVLSKFEAEHLSKTCIFLLISKITSSPEKCPMINTHSLSCVQKQIEPLSNYVTIKDQVYNTQSNMLTKMDNLKLNKNLMVTIIKIGNHPKELQLYDLNKLLIDHIDITKISMIHKLNISLITTYDKSYTSLYNSFCYNDDNLVIQNCIITPQNSFCKSKNNIFKDIERYSLTLKKDNSFSIIKKTEQIKNVLSENINNNYVMKLINADKNIKDKYNDLFNKISVQYQSKVFKTKIIKKIKIVLNILYTTDNKNCISLTNQYCLSHITKLKTIIKESVHYLQKLYLNVEFLIKSIEFKNNKNTNIRIEFFSSNFSRDIKIINDMYTVKPAVIQIQTETPMPHYVAHAISRALKIPPQGGLSYNQINSRLFVDSTLGPQALLVNNIGSQFIETTYHTSETKCRIIFDKNKLQISDCTNYYKIEQAKKSIQNNITAEYFYTVATSLDMITKPPNIKTSWDPNNNCALINYVQQLYICEKESHYMSVSQLDDPQIYYYIMTNCPKCTQSFMTTDSANYKTELAKIMKSKKIENIPPIELNMDLMISDLQNKHKYVPVFNSIEEAYLNIPTNFLEIKTIGKLSYAINNDYKCILIASTENEKYVNLGEISGIFNAPFGIKYTKIKIPYKRETICCYKGVEC